MALLPTFFGRRQRRPSGILSIWAGVAAPLVYASTVIAGATAIAGYSHLSDPISALTETGRTGVLWIGAGFLLYNLLVAAFGIWGLRATWRQPRWRAVFFLLLVTAACGLLMWPFPQDPIGLPASSTGIVHVVLAAIESLSSMAILAISIRALWTEGHRRLAAFSGACLALIVPFGFAAALATAGHGQLMGLFERLTIGAFEAWLGIFALSCALGLLAADAPD